MSWDTNQFLSQGAERIISDLAPFERDDGHQISPGTQDFRLWDTRLGDTETLHSWFFRITGGSLSEQVQRRLSACMFEENAAFFGRCTWKGGRLYACSFQVLVVDGKDLLSFRNNDSGCRPTYYRLDVEELFRGNLFDHAVPHIHCGGNGAPRFPFPIQPGESPLAAFLEFIYHHHFYSKWIDWAEFECSSDPLATVTICEKLFQAGSLSPEQTSHIQALDRIRAVLSKARKRWSHRLNVFPESWNRLNYNFFPNDTAI